ncbi:MAG TPA: PAS domain-containing protein [Rhizomicrobium sp.]|nr:PAS domain-containing protein [Rhizomicrobium sp.]
MKHRNSHLLVGYWSRIRRGRRAPDQSDIDPRAIKRMLSQVFILEAHDAACPAYRLAGTVLCDRFGQELRGTNFLSIWEARARDTLALLLEQSLATSVPVCFSAVGETVRCTTIETETVLAPLAFGSGTPQRFLGITQFLGDASQLDGSIVLLRLTGSKMIREDEPGYTDFEPPAPPPFESGRRSGRAPHLRLVVSRDRPTLHADMDQTMRSVIESFDFSRTERLVR